MAHLIFKNETDTAFLVGFESLVPAHEPESEDDEFVAAHWGVGGRPAYAIQPQWKVPSLPRSDQIQQVHIGQELRALVSGNGQLTVKNHSQAPTVVCVHKQVLAKIGEPPAEEVMEDTRVSQWMDTPRSLDTRIGPNDQWTTLFLEPGVRFRLTHEG